jgi:hypothetical protein
MADKKSFVIYDNWSRLFCGLPDETAGKLIKAVCAYKLGEGAEVNDPVIAAIYAMICEQLDADADKYADICEKRSQARKNKTQQMITNDNKCKQALSSATDNENDNDNVNDTDTDNDNENVKGNDNTKKTRKKKPAVTRDVYFPNDELLDKAFRDYVNMRIEIKKPFVTDEAIDKAMQKLTRLSGGNNDIAIQICNESVMNSWQGLFAIKSGDSGRSQNTAIDWSKV